MITPEEFFGTLQASITDTWRDHLQSSAYSEHKILEGYYDEMTELVDSLIEAWQADHEVIKDYKDLMEGKEDLKPIEYLKEIRRITEEGRELMDSDVLKSEVDDIMKLIMSTIYQLEHLVKESCSLADYIARSL